MDPLSALPGIRQSAPPTTGRGDEDLGQADFLKLMIKQLENQDPMSPQDSGDFLGQIAQFGTVSGIQDLQGAFSELSTSLTADRALRGAALLDRSVMLDADRARLDAGGSVDGVLDLRGTANEVVLEITSPTGERVRRMEFGRLSAGATEFGWDGLDDNGRAVPPGDYGINATARIDGQTEQLPVQVRARVRGISMDPASGALRIDVGSREPVDLADVRRID